MAEMNREQETEEILTDAGAAAQDGGDCPEQETETAEKMPERKPQRRKAGKVFLRKRRKKTKKTNRSKI